MKRAGFTLIELLVVIAVLAVLAVILTPVATHAMAAGRSAACQSNLRQMQIAFNMYLNDHDGRFFPWRENTPEGALWYWGLERAGRGGRALDRSRARLAPYLGKGAVETCPAFPYEAASFMQKFETKSYGYGINVYLLSDTPEGRAMGASIGRVDRPDQTLAWGDAIQINDFQPPATPSRPRLEEWYYIADRARERPTAHFRHRRRMNAAMLDGSVHSLTPKRLLPQCDGQVGYLAGLGSAIFLNPTSP